MHVLKPTRILLYSVKLRYSGNLCWQLQYFMNLNTSHVGLHSKDKFEQFQYVTKECIVERNRILNQGPGKFLTEPLPS